MPAASPLSARRLALAVLEQVCAGKELEHAWADNAPLAKGTEERDRAFARQLVLSTLRYYGAMQAQLAKFLKKKPPERVMLILLLGMAQLLWLETPPHAAVDTSVTLAKKSGLIPFSGMVNAVLKKIAADAASLRSTCQPRDNMPEWLRKKLGGAYSEQGLQAMAQAHLEAPQLDISLRDVSQREAWAQALEATVLPTGTLRRALASEVRQLPGFAEGAWWVQDAASALPVRLFSRLAGMRALDLCAAPGGKTLQMAAAGADVTAVDRSGARLKRLHENLERTGLKATVIEADARHYTPSAPPQRILLDAPCTATGTLRRHPDVALHRKPSDLTELASLQQEILAHAFHLLASGGELVYCVCSLLPEEGEAQIERFLAAHPEARVLPVNAEAMGIPSSWVTPQGGLRTLPSYWRETGGLDGFFAIRLGKE
jgi:16S rRNA (cytosine967-C5)-methyltransferase